MYTYEELKNFVDHCGRCPLAIPKTGAVMGKGNLHSPLMFIAEAPGQKEDREGIPFTGRSGEVFDRLLNSAGMTREEVYLTNVVKCHPPANRDPKPEEQEACIQYLKYETAPLRPKIMVCLGRIAAQRIIRPGLPHHQRAWNVPAAERRMADGGRPPYSRPFARRIEMGGDGSGFSCCPGKMDVAGNKIVNLPGKGWLE